MSKDNFKVPESIKEAVQALYENQHSAIDIEVQLERNQLLSENRSIEWEINAKSALAHYKKRVETLTDWLEWQRKAETAVDKKETMQLKEIIALQRQVAKLKEELEIESRLRETAEVELDQVRARAKFVGNTVREVDIAAHAGTVQSCIDKEDYVEAGKAASKLSNLVNPRVFKKEG